jgi:hypothetical protein
MIRILNSIRHSHTARILAACILLACGMAEAWSATYYWRSSAVTEGNWADSASWSTTGYNGAAGSAYPVAGDTVYFTGEGNAVSADLTAAAYAATVYFNTGGSNAVTINLNGYSLTVSGTAILSGTSTATYASTVDINGSGSCTVNALDSSTDQYAYLNLSGSTVMTVTTALYGNTNAGFYITDTDNSCTLYVPASGVNVDYGSSSITYSPADLPKPYGTPSIYKVTASDSGFPSSAMSLTLTRASSSGTATVSYAYTVAVTDSDSAVSESYTLDGTTVTDGSTGSLTVPTGSTSKSFNLICTGGSIDAGDGITVTFKTPDGSMDLAEITYIQGAYIWSGATDSEWSTVTNWKNGSVPSSTSVVTIPSGCTNYPEITGTAAAKSIAINSNAELTMNGGSLSVTKITASGTGKITGASGSSSGTVTFTGTSASWTADYPSYSTFPDVSITSGSVCTPASDMYITGSLTNSGTYDAQTSSIKTVFQPYSTSAVTGTSSYSHTLFGTLSCTNQGGKTLSFANYITVNTLVLSGTSSGSLLSVTGSSGYIDLTSDQAGGRYISLESSAPVITDGSTEAGHTYTIYASSAVSTTPAGWIIDSSGTYVWLGVTTSWSSTSNWSTGSVPASGSDVVIPAGVSAYPVLSAAVTVSTITIASGATLDLGGQTLTVTTLTNNGRLRLKGTETLTGITTYTPSSATTIEYYGTASITDAAYLFGVSFYNLTVASPGALTISTSVTVANLLKNAGTFTSISSSVTVSGSITNTGTFTGGIVTVTPADTTTITGTSTASDTTFSTLTCTGQGGKKLAVEGALSITTLTLTGTSTSSLLAIDGSGSMTLASSQSGGQYLSVENVPISSKTYTVTNSYSSAPPSGWSGLTTTSTYTWTGGTSTDWSDTANWTVGGSEPSAVPSSTDTVIIPSSVSSEPSLTAAAYAGTLTIKSGRTLTVGSNTLTVADSWTNAGTVSIGGGTVSLPSSSSDIDEEGTWEYTADGTVNTDLTYYDVTVSSGTLTTSAALKADSTLTVSSGATLTFGSGCTAATVDNAGTVNLSAYSFAVSGTLTNSGTMQTAGGTVTLGSTASESGTWEYTGGTARTITNLTYNNLLISGTVSTSGAITAVTLTNSSTLTLGGDITLTGALTNSGTAEVGTHALSFVSYTLGGSDTVTVSTGSITMTGAVDSSITTASVTGSSAGYSFINSGTKKLTLSSLTLTSGESVKFNASGTGSSITVTGATYNGAAVTTDGTVVLPSGTVGTVTVNSGSSLTLAGGMTTGAVSVTGTLTTSGTLTVSSMTLASGSSLSLGGNLTLTGNWTNNGAATFTHNNKIVIFTPSAASSIGGSASTSFYNLTCAGQNGKELDINKMISVAGTLTLSGTSAGNLIIGGTSGSGIKLTTTQTGGSYLTVNTDDVKIYDSTGTTAGGSIYTATYSKNSSDNTGLISGWNLLSGSLSYVWNGSSSTGWSTAVNWNTGIAPAGAGTEVVDIPYISGATFTGTPYYPVLTSDVSVGMLTVDADAALDCAGRNITAATAFTNDGTLRFSGSPNTITLSSGTASYGSSNTVEYYGGGVCAAVSGTGAPVAADYHNLTITGNATVVRLGAKSITVGGTLSNNGTIEVNGTGTFGLTGTADTDSGLVKYSSTTATTTTIPALSYYNLEVSGGTWTDAAALTAAHNIIISGGLLTCANKLTAGAGLSVSGGTLKTNGDLSVTGTLAVSAGTMQVNNAGISACASSAGTCSFTGGTVSFGTNASDTFTVGSSGISFSSGLTLLSGAGTLTATGSTITLGKDVTLNNTIEFASGVTLAGSVELATGASSYGIKFDEAVTCTTNTLTTSGSGTVTIASGKTFSSTTGSLIFGGAVTNGGTLSSASGIQTYAGAVTNNGTINVPAVATGNTAVSFKSAYTGNSGSSLTGNISTNPYIDFYGDVTFSSSSTTFTPNGDIVRFCGTGNQAFVPGSTNTYDSLSVTNTGGTVSIADGNTFIQDTTTAGTYTFEVAVGAGVTVGTGKFVVDTLAVAGTFTQTGANASGAASLQSVQNITGTGSVTWDYDSDGGYLTLGGCSSTGTVAFNHKNVTITGSTSLTGVVFYDLYIPDGVTVTNGGTITVIRNFTLSDADSDSDNGTYTPSGGTLYLGGMASSGVASASGTVTDNSTTVQSLGTVVINGDSQNAAKTAAAAVKTASLTVTAGTLAMGTNALTVTGAASIDGTITGSGIMDYGSNVTNNGTITAGTGNVTFGGNYSGTNAAAGLPSFTASSGITYFKGNADLSGTTFAANGGTVDFNGSSTQTLTINTTSGTTFSTLDVTTSGGTFSVTDDTAKILTADVITVDTTQNVTFGSAVKTSGGTKKVTITDVGTVLFKQSVDADTLVLTQTGGVTFNGTVTAGVLTDASTAGTITFDSNVSVTTLTGGVFNTTGTVTLGNDGSGTDTASFTNGISHTAGGTVLACALSTTDAAVAFGNATGPKTVTVNKSSSITTGGTGSGNGTVILNGTLSLGSGLSVGSGSDGITIGASAAFTGDYTLTLTNTGTADTVLSGDITTGTGGQGTVTVDSGSGAVSFNGNTGTFAKAVKAVTFTKSGGTVSFADSKNVYCGTLTTGAGSGVTFGDGSTVSLSTLAVTTGSYPVTIKSTSFSVTGSSSTAFNNTGILTLGNGTGDACTFAGGMTDTDGSAGRQTNLIGSLKTTNSDIELDNLVLTGTASIDTNTAAGDITINGTITNSTARALTLNAGTGAVKVTGTAGSGNALLSLTITDSAALTFSSTVTVSGALTQTNAATGTTTFGGAVTAGFAVLRGIGVDIQQGITATGAVSVTNSGTLTVADTTGTSDTGTYDIIAPGGFTQSSGGASAAVSIAGDVSTTGTALSFASPLTLIGDVKLYSAGAGNITCSGTINSDSTARNLAVDAGSGKASFGGSIGSTALSAISAKSTSASTDTIAFGSSCTSVTTTGTQTYTGAVTFGTGTTLTAYGSGAAQLVTFTGAVTGGTNSLTLGMVSTAPTNVSFGSTVSGVTTLGVSGNAVFGGAVSSTGTISISGTTDINTSSVATTGAQTYTGAVTLGTGTTLTAYGSGAARLVTFGGTVTGGTHSLTLGTVSTAPANVSFGSTVSGITSLGVSGNAVFGGAVTSTGTISVSGTTAVNTPAITTTSTQLYTGDVTLGTSTALTGSGVTFSSSINGTTDGSQNLTIDTGSSSGTITFAGSVGDTVPPGDVALTGAASFGSSFKQNTANSFTLTSGSVSVLQYEFIAGDVSITSGTFTQTGYNSSDGTSSGTVYTQSAASLTTASGTTMNWDSGDNGGSLTVSGNINADGTLSFHYKDLTISGALSIDGNMTLLDLIVDDGGSVTINDGANLTVMRHVTLNSSSTFSNAGTGSLYLTNTTSSSVADKNGIIQDNNATSQNLGDVVITQGTTSKTFSTAVTADTITMSDTTASAGTVTFDGLLTITTLTNGTSGTVPSFAVAFDGGTKITDAVSFYTAGTVTVGNDSGDSCIFTGGISHTDSTTMRTTMLGGSLTTSDASVTFDNLILDADSSVTTKSSGGSGAGIIVNGTVSNSSSHALSLTAGTGNIQLTGVVGTSSVRLGALTVVSAYNVAGDNTASAVPSAAAGALYAASLTQDAGSGTTRLSSADLTGDMNLTVTGTGITADSTITASSVVLAGGSVDLNDTVTAPSGFSSTGTTFDNTGAAITTTGTGLTINHTGAVTAGAALSSGADTAGAVTVTSSGGTVTVSGAVTSGAGTITVTGTGSSYAVSITGALSSTSGSIDIDSASTLALSNTVTATTGNVTIDSSGSSSLSSAADITTTTGTVTFGASKSGALSTAGDITTSGITSDNSGSITFTNAVTLTDGVALTTDSGSSTGGTVTFGSSLDSDAVGTERALTIDAGNGAVTFTGAAGSTVPLSSLTLIYSGALTFSRALTVSGAVTQTNAATGATLFGGSTATAAATSVGSADLNGTSYTLYGDFTVTSGAMSVTNSGLFLSAENADITLTSGSFTQDGSGLNQLAGGITTSGTGAVTFAADVYLYGSDTSMQLGGGSGAVTVGASGTKNLHIAASTASKIITIASPLTAENIVLYGGTLSPGAAVTANADLVLLNGNTGTMYTDSATELSTLYAYNTASSPSRSGTAVPSLSSFPSVYPDGTTFIDGSSTSYCGAVSGLAGHTLTAGQNFYDNGVDLTGTAAWTLELKDNSTATNAFAEAYNCTIAYCTVTCTTSGGSAWVSAAENCTNNGNNTDQTNSTADGIAFSRPVILVNNAAVAVDRGTVTASGWTANLSGTYTVYDDVIRVEFVDSLSAATPLKIENSRNEIYKAVSRIQYYSGSSLVSFTGTYTDADCTTSTGTAADGSDSAGDLSVFYIKASATWNTDATGISAGQEDTTSGSIHYDTSTDRSGTHRSTIPCLNLPKALSSVYATLRDCHKNRIGNYDGLPSSNNYDLDGDSLNDSNTAASAGRFTAVADRASPVLIAAYTGQETHTAYSGTAASQPYYDAHNFIEFVYSEAVNIGDLTVSGGAENARAETSFASDSEHGGSIETSGSGLEVTGIAGISSGALSAGSRTTGSTDSTVSSLYRTFPLTAGGTAEAQTDRVRVSIAGYVNGTISANGNSYRNWIGYIDSAETPSGIVTSLENNFITDAAGNVLDDYAAASGTSNHSLNVLTISNTETELYGPWDTSAPVFAPFRRSSSSSGWSEYKNPEYCEAIGNTETGNTTLDRIEFHLFDNTPSFSSSDDYVWFSRRGWCSYDTYSSLYTSYSYASDLFGGSRPFDSTAAARTSGGIRYSSVYNSMSAFKYAVGTNATPASSFNTGKTITGGAKGTVFSTTTDTYNTTGTTDSLYFAVYLSDTTLARKSTFSVSYDADTGFITDLAGNRLKSDQINTLDLTPPEFNMTISPVGNDFLYVVFGKALNLTELLWIDDAGTHTTYSDPLSLIPKSLELVDTSTGTPSTDIAIDENTPAVKIFENDDYTGLMFKLSQNTQLTDVENVYLRVKNIGTSTDPVTGISGAYISYIQDSLGNSMTLYNAHALSDYAVNVVNPQYAYNIDDDSNISDVINSYHSDGSWSVHDWNADQGNYGTLMSGENIFIHAGLADGTDDNSGGLPVNVTAYFDTNPQSNAVSVTYNSNTSQNWRIWLPGVTSDIFEALAPINNPLSSTGFISTAGAAGDEDKTYMNFTLASTDLSSKGWKAGDQVKFLFGIMDSSAAPQPVMIRHVPVFNGDSTGGYYTGTEYPLYALRLTQSLSSSDTLASAGKKIASSLDLWSFKLKSLVSQRGGVTILNNVINASSGESTVVKVTMPSDGSLSVVVMTLDGDIVQYLQHGTTSSGDHYYNWNGTTKSGKRVARGMYFIRVFGTGIDETRKVMVVKD